MVDEEMQVAMIDPSLYTPPYDSHLCASLRQLGVSVRLYCRKPRRDDPGLSDECRPVFHFYRLSERLRAAQVPQVLVTMVKIVEHILDMYRLERTIIRSEIDIVHWQWVSLPIVDFLFLRRLAKRVPQIITVHDTDLFRAAGLRRLSTMGWRECLSACQKAVAHLTVSKDRLIGMGIPEDKIAVIPHGLFGSDDKISDSGASEINRKPVQFLVFGRIAPYKGVVEFLRLVDSLPEETKRSAEFAVRGRSALPNKSLAEIKSLGERNECIKLHLRHHSDDELNTAIVESDVAVFPYLAIDASGALMQAAAHDLALLCSTTPAFTEVLEEGRFGMLLDLKDEARWRDNISQLVSDRSYLSRAKRLVRDLRTGPLSWKAIGESTIELYTGLLNSDERSSGKSLETN